MKEQRLQTTYTNDAASRLTGMASSIASYQFALDGDGNRVQSAETQPIAPTAYNGVSAVYTYNTAKDRLLSAGLLSYSYDNEGQIASAGSTTLTFDYNHRVTAVGSDTTFSYDGRGRRLTATRSGVTTLYIYDPWGNLVAEADSSKNITRKYIYGKGLVAMAMPAGLYCYHFNGIGSTVAITDMNGNIVNSYAYEPFGAIVSQQETITQPFKFVGQYGVMAEPSGLYYMRARYYDPSVGRFISEDPIGFGGGDVNLYAYVLNNPVNRIDPFGEDPCQPCHCGCEKCHIVPMLVTAYDNSFASTGKNPGDPGYGITTGGTTAATGTIAAPKSYPFGTSMFVPGYGCGTVQDRGGAIKGLRIDAWFATTQAANNWGVPYLNVEVCDD